MAGGPFSKFEAQWKLRDVDMEAIHHYNREENKGMDASYSKLPTFV
jgi:hypothetical protein